MSVIKISGNVAKEYSTQVNNVNLNTSACHCFQLRMRVNQICSEQPRRVQMGMPRRFAMPRYAIHKE